MGETGSLLWPIIPTSLPIRHRETTCCIPWYIVVVTVVIAIVVAYLLALYLRFVKSRISKTIGMLYLLPRFVPSMCAVYAMITIIRDSGLVNRIGQLFGVDINLGMMYHASGIITMTLVQHPLCGYDDCRRPRRNPGFHH